LIQNYYGRFPYRNWNSNLEYQDDKNSIKLRNILGCVLFGIGWGISGICPSVAIMTVFIYIPHISLFLLLVFTGQEIATKVK